jgi:hypothetical protein
VLRRLTRRFDAVGCFFTRHLFPIAGLRRHGVMIR